MALMASVMALQALSIDTMLPALPEIGTDLGAPAGNSRQLVVSLYIVFNGIGCLFPGALADRFGRRPVVLTALIFYFVLSIACVLVTGFNELIVLRCMQGVLASSLSVIPAAIIRDRYEGDRMARLMSMISAVFITVPILAPSLGQLILIVGHWRWIFAFLALASLGVGVWFWRRMPETMHPEFRQPIQLGPMAGHMWKAISTRASFGYVLSTALVMSGIFGYLTSAQQLIGEHFGAGRYFALIFGICAAAMIVSNITNARIVERFGARRVSHTGLLLFIAVSAAQVWFAFGQWQSLVWFMPLIAANMALLGFLGANFSSISMQPFAQSAGAASSAQNFIRLLGGALLGMLIGQAYDGTSRTIAVALLASGILALILILFSEKGRLFRRLNPPRRLQ